MGLGPTQADENQFPFSNYSPWNHRPPLVIPTGAYPDFLLRAASDVYVCGSPQREPYADPQRHGSPQEIRGSAVEGPAVSVLLDPTPGHHRPSPCHPDRSAVEGPAVSVLLDPTPGHHRPPLCHLDRSEAEWRDLCVDALSWK
jgi:hypothetical protein